MNVSICFVRCDPNVEARNPFWVSPPGIFQDPFQAPFREQVPSNDSSVIRLQK